MNEETWLETFCYFIADHLPRKLVLACFRRVFVASLYDGCGPDFYETLPCLKAEENWEEQ